MADIKEVCELANKFAEESEEVSKKDAIELMKAFSGIQSMIEFVYNYYSETNKNNKRQNEESIADSTTNRQIVIAYKNAWNRANEVFEAETKAKYKSHHELIKSEIESYFADTALDVLSAKYHSFTDLLEKHNQEKAKEELIASAKKNKQSAKRQITNLKNKIEKEADASEKAELEKQLAKEQKKRDEAQSIIDANKAKAE